MELNRSLKMMMKVDMAGTAGRNYLRYYPVCRMFMKYTHNTT